MFHKLYRKFQKNRRNKQQKTVNPDETFLDSSNIPSFNRDQFEGRIETPISKKYLFIFKFIFIIVAAIFIFRAGSLQIINGGFYYAKAATNNLKKEVIFSHRGIIADRNDVPLAWNEEGSTTSASYDSGTYINEPGFGNLLGFVKYPGQDTAGNFYSYSILGQDGIEKYFNDQLSGQNGAMLSEVSVSDKIQSQSTLEPPINGDKIDLSIDSGMQTALYNSIKSAVTKSGFSGGSAVIMDAKTGEVIAMVSYPDYDSNVMTDGKDKTQISAYLQSKNQPFLNRVVSGLYAPGSIIKPFVATGVLAEKIIDPNKEIHTVGFISVPNPYDPAHPSIFKDWKDQGDVDLRKAIAVSSDAYFYIVGGGYGNQKGLGIDKIGEYVSKFLFGEPTDGFFAGPDGTIPSPAWKKKVFNGDEWRIGDTYHTVIGQYGFQVTPLQVARAMTGIANDGTVVSPTIIKGEQGTTTPVTGVDKSYYTIIKEGMRQAVTSQTAIALNIPGVTVAAKTGTAQIGVLKDHVNSWVEGFFPYDNPKYTFALVLEDGPTTYAVSSMRAMSDTLSWAKQNSPSYVQE